MADMMWRVGKHEGLGNIVMEQVPIPDLGPNEVLVRVHRSLISRGSELWRRYVMPGPVDPRSMGYSTAGVVEKVGSEVTRFAPGDRVSCTAPHAEYAIGDASAAAKRRVVHLPDDVPFVDGTFQPLITSSIGWTATAGIQPQHTVTILGLGLVGNLVMQAATRFLPALLCGIDMLPIRRRLAEERNMGTIIDGAARDPVESVLELTDGKGADIVIDCVGGRAGVKSFAQAQDMMGAGGLLQIIGLYHDGPLPLDATKMQRKRLIGGYLMETDVDANARAAMEALSSGLVQAAPLVTHHFSGNQAKEAFDLLYEHPEDAMGVIMEWA
ncbi:MAG: zinc-binding dehydrogenase [Chloroflexota bacterium]|nr:zinc-binding dehydrogenase [Chloroflexota bacterium]MDE2930991.1 zinc-binding dehydrogenase [Chloroflexota bacterium]